MASSLRLMPMRLSRYASAARLAAAYAASARDAGASALALARYAARNPERCVRLPSSAAAGARGPASGADHDSSSSSADQQQCKKEEEVMRSYERVHRVPFEAKEEDMESEEALWALYERWCEHFKMDHVQARVAEVASATSRL